MSRRYLYDGTVVDPARHGGLLETPWDHMVNRKSQTDTDLLRRIVRLEHELRHVKKTTSALKAGYREAFDNAGAGIAHVDVSGQFLDANARFCEMINISRSDIQTIKFTDVTYPDDLLENIEQLERLLNGEIAGYRLEKRYVRTDGKVFWADLNVSAVRDRDGRPLRLVSIITDITQQKVEKEHLVLLMGEASHRTKNLICVVRSIIRHSANDAVSVNDLENVLLDRIAGLAAAQDALLAAANKRADIRDLVGSQLAVFIDPNSRQIVFDGPDLSFSPVVTRAVGMALHELATNSCKYGALSSAAGQIVINWTADYSQQAFHMSWQESGGPRVAAPTHRGFGQRVMVDLVETSTGGNVDLDFDPAGARWSLVAPLTVLC